MPRWGYDLYPERKGGRFIPKWYEYFMLKGNEEYERKKCEKRIWEMTQTREFSVHNLLVYYFVLKMNLIFILHTDPLLKIMLRALKSSGW